MSWMLMPLRRYAEFRGRSRRKEFWLFVLFLWLGATVAAIVDTSLGFGQVNSAATNIGFSYRWSVNGPVTGLFWLAMLVPNLAVSVRRLHDSDRSGWFLLFWFLPLIGWIVLLVFFCLEGTRGPNRFGIDPKGPDLASTFA